MNEKQRPRPPGRRTPAHPEVVQRLDREDGAVVFLTVCTAGHPVRRPLLARPAAVALLRASWAAAHSWQVGRWVVMPDHVHLFCSPADFPARPLKQWVRYWKTRVSHAWPWPEEQPIWQPDFWDTQMRTEAHHADRWEYIRQNPVRHALAARPEDWPFQGEENNLS